MISVAFLTSMKQLEDFVTPALQDLRSQPEHEKYIASNGLLTSITAVFSRTWLETIHFVGEVFHLMTLQLADGSSAVKDFLRSDSAR